MIGSRRTSILGVIGTVCLLAATPAAAEVSSVDAYGGQASVLGKPVHKHVHRVVSSGELSGGGGEQGSSTGVSGGGSSGRPPSSPGSGSSESGAGARPSGGTTPHNGGKVTGANTAGIVGRATLVSSSSSSVSLSLLDALLVVLFVLAMVAVAVAIRRLERPAR